MCKLKYSIRAGLRADVGNAEDGDLRSEFLRFETEEERRRLERGEVFENRLSTSEE